MRKLRALALIVLVVVALAFVWWRYGTREVPAGQPPLATIEATTLAAVREDFNRAAGGTRLVVLLSPM